MRDVSAQMDATTAVLEALDPGDPVGVLEQNFAYDLLDPPALLQKYAGKTVTVVHEARFAGEHDTRENAKVLSVYGVVLPGLYRGLARLGSRERHYDAPVSRPRALVLGRGCDAGV